MTVTIFVQFVVLWLRTAMLYQAIIVQIELGQCITTKTSSPFKVDDRLLISGYKQWGILIDLTSFGHWTSVLIGILSPTALLNVCVLLPKAGAIPIGQCLHDLPVEHQPIAHQDMPALLWQHFRGTSQIILTKRSLQIM